MSVVLSHFDYSCTRLYFIALLNAQKPDGPQSTP